MSRPPPGYPAQRYDLSAYGQTPTHHEPQSLGEYANHSARDVYSTNAMQNPGLVPITRPNDSQQPHLAQHGHYMPHGSAYYNAQPSAHSQMQYAYPPPYQSPTAYQHMALQQPSHVWQPPISQDLHLQPSLMHPLSYVPPQMLQPGHARVMQQQYHSQSLAAIPGVDGSGSLRPQLMHQANAPSHPDRDILQPSNDANQLPLKHVDSERLSAKRRKSNEGAAVAVHDRTGSSLQGMVPLTRPSVEGWPSQISKDPNLSKILLALADEYIHAAHIMRVESKDDSERYLRLVSTTVACLRAALDCKTLDLREESRLRLRLAGLLYDETEDTEQAEEILSKGIAACEEARYFDLKYAMQHLYIRNLHSSNAKAAGKLLEKALKEVEETKQLPWQYAFLALKVTQCLQHDDLHQLRASLRHVLLLRDLADERNATSMRILCFSLQALAEFAIGDDIESAQRAVADARSFQLSSEMKTMPQVEALLNCLQMISQVPQFSSDAMYTEVRQLHPAQNTLSKASQWSRDGHFGVTLDLGATPEHIVEDSGGIFVDRDGKLALDIKWLTSAEMMTICYTLCGIASMPKNGEKCEAEKFLQQALKINQMSSSRHRTRSDILRQQQLSDRLKYLLASAMAARANYVEAQQIIGDVDRSSEQARFRLLRGICEQGQGHLDAALQLYEVEIARLKEQSEVKISSRERDIQILAGLNSVYIKRQLNQPGIDVLLDLLEPYCLEHVNRNFTSAYHVIVATVEHANATIMDTKNRLSHGLRPAQATKNQQLLAIIMSMMTEIFFTDIVGDQAQKSSHAAYAIAAKNGDPLWKAVGLGKYRSTLERMGDVEKATELDLVAQKVVSALPLTVAKALDLL